MDFVVKNDSSFYYGGAHVFLGTLYGSRPKMLGGNIDHCQRPFCKGPPHQRRANS